MVAKSIVETVHRHLFAEQDSHVYVVLDGASVAKLPQVLWKHKPESICLYRGELEPDLAAAAPYLVELKHDAPFTQWVLQEGWGNHWGIFAQSSADFRSMRKHFRTFLMVKDSDGNSIYFRYYDPRVLLAFLPTCNGQEMKVLFGPIDSYLMESADGNQIMRFSCAESSLKRQSIRLLETA